jgi:hypothetical protein
MVTDQEKLQTRKHYSDRVFRNAAKGNDPMLQKIIRSIYRVLAWSFVVGLVIQVYLAGLGVFQFRNFSYGEDGVRSFYGLHIEFGWLLGMVALLLLVLAFAARYPRGTVGRAAGLFLLMVVQSLILYINSDSALIRAFHPVNAIAVGWLSLSLARQVSKIESETEASRLSVEKQAI